MDVGRKTVLNAFEYLLTTRKPLKIAKLTINYYAMDSSMLRFVHGKKEVRKHAKTQRKRGHYDLRGSINAARTQKARP
jgi:hypothetical protein